MATAHNCDFCSNSDCNLGVQDLIKVTHKYLSDILKEESGFNDKKKKHKVGNKLMGHYNSYLKYVYGLTDGLDQKFNNLALDKIRTDKDNAVNLGKYITSMGKCCYYIVNNTMQECYVFLCIKFQLNCSTWEMEINYLTTSLLQRSYSGDLTQILIRELRRDQFSFQKLLYRHTPELLILNILKSS